MQQIYDDGLIKKDETGAYKVISDQEEIKNLQA